MAVPYTFGTATAAIPLSQLDSNFATAITIGNTAVQLGNTVTTLNNMTLANVTISSGTITITNVAVTTANVSGTANVSTLVVVGNETVGGNTTVGGNVTLSGGTANGVAYLNGSKVLTTGSSLTWDGTNLTVNTGTVSAAYGKLTVAGGISITPDSSSKFQIGRYSAGAPYSYIKMGSTSSGLKFTDPADSVDLMTLSSTGALALYGASTSANGVGITFPATQSASSDANTLDDYEEGTWTPAFSAGGITGTSITYSGTYTKVGRVVTVGFLAASGSGNINVSSYASFTGLPFSASATFSGSVTTEDIDVFASLGFAQVSGASFAVSKCGNGTTANLSGTCTYFV
jgi:hypothetical protein